MGIRAVLFDYGGVLADEGFYQGLLDMGRANGRDPQAFFEGVRDAIFDSGYLYGRADEAAFWRLVIERQGPLAGRPEEWREDILGRFTLRRWMMAVVRAVRGSGRATAILSDQVDWLDRLDARDGFFDDFDEVFNSFHHGWTKREPEFFLLALDRLAVEPGQALFIDDAAHNVALARSLGIASIHYSGRDDFLAQLAGQLPDLAELAGAIAIAGATAP